MARDKAACVARQAAVSRHGDGLGSKRARRGVLGAQAGAGALGWACVGRWAGRGRRGTRQAGRRAGVAHGRRGARQGRAAGARGRGARQGRAAGRALGRGAHGKQAQACGRELGALADARARGKARRRAAGAHGAAGWALLCAPGHASWASWVLVHPAWFSTRFFF